MSAFSLRSSLPWIAGGLMLASFGVSAPALAESCAGDIDQVQSQVDAALARHAETAPFAPETSFATLGHQPTPATVARAEAGLEHWAGGDQAVAALTRARDADAAGSASQCLADVQAARRALRTP